MQGIVDQNDAKPERKRRPQTVAFSAENRMNGGDGRRSQDDKSGVEEETNRLRPHPSFPQIASNLGKIHLPLKGKAHRNARLQGPSPAPKARFRGRWQRAALTDEVVTP